MFMFYLYHIYSTHFKVCVDVKDFPWANRAMPWNRICFVNVKLNYLPTCTNILVSGQHPTSFV